MTRHAPLVSLLLVVLVLAPASAFAQSSPWPSEPAPAPLGPHDVTFPPYELRTLPNGMQVVVVMHHEQPAVSLRLIVRAGSAQDPPGKSGTAMLAASLLDQGTATRSAGQIADVLDSVGGNCDTGAGRDLSFAHVVVMKDSLDVGLGLLADEIRSPSFADAEIARQRQQTLSGLKVAYEDPAYVANIVFDRLVYGSSPYGAPSNGTPDSLPRITRADLVAFHDKWYVPNNCLLAVVGDITGDEALAGVARVFGDWPKRELAPDAPIVAPAPARRVVIVDKPGAVQTEVRVGHLGVPRKQHDFLALDLAIDILGGEGANRLHRVLRTERGLTYDASAEMETLKRTGQFVAITNTRSEATGEVLRLIVEQFNRLRSERVNDEELADVKAYLTGNFPLKLETPDDIAVQVLNVLFYDLPLEELQTYRQRVNAVSASDIGRVANEYLLPGSLSVVLVGDARAFASRLRPVGFDKYDVIPAADLDVTSGDLRRSVVGAGGAGGASWAGGAGGAAGRSEGEAADGASEMDQQNNASARDVLQRAIRAKGGAESLRGVHTLLATGTLTVRSPRPLQGRTTIYVRYPDSFRVDAALPNGDVTQVYAAGQTWMKDPSGVHDVDRQEGERLRNNAARDLVSLLLKAADGKVQVRLLPEERGTGAAAVDTLQLSGDGMPPVDLLVDRSTGMIAAERYFVEQPGAIGKVPTEEWYSDYRAVDGIKVAFKTVVRRGEAVILERTLTDLKINVPIEDGTFKRPI